MVSAPRGLPAPGRGVMLLWGGGGGIRACTEPDLLCGQNDRQVYYYY